MNLKQAQIIVDIAEYIKGVKKCNQCGGVNSSTLSHDEPACFFANGYRAGIIGRNLAGELQYSFGLAEKFNVSEESAHRLIYPTDSCEHSGKVYYTAAKKFLDENGYEGL